MIHRFFRELPCSSSSSITADIIVQQQQQAATLHRLPAARCHPSAGKAEKRFFYLFLQHARQTPPTPHPPHTSSIYSVTFHSEAATQLKEICICCRCCRRCCDLMCLCFHLPSSFLSQSLSRSFVRHHVLSRIGNCCCCCCCGPGVANLNASVIAALPAR